MKYYVVEWHFHINWDWLILLWPMMIILILNYILFILFYLGIPLLGVILQQSPKFAIFHQLDIKTDAHECKWMNIIHIVCSIGYQSIL